MKNFSATFLQTLNAGARKLSTCWLITLPDDTNIGFTDGDRPITIAGITYSPDGGFRRSDNDKSVDNGADQIVIESYFSTQITEQMVISGQLRGAKVFIFQVDPRNLPTSLDDDPLTFNPVNRGRIVAVNRTDTGYTATIQGIHSWLSQRSGWQVAPICRNKFCDALCGLNIATYTNTAEVEGVTSRQAVVIDFDFKDNEYTGGKLTWTDGDNQGWETTIVYSNGRTLRFLDPTPNDITVGDHATIQRQCDKSYQTCVSVFGNGVRFNGEPGLPGDEVLNNSTQVEP